jgi:hypothetical protein
VGETTVRGFYMRTGWAFWANKLDNKENRLRYGLIGSSVIRTTVSLRKGYMHYRRSFPIWTARRRPTRHPLLQPCVNFINHVVVFLAEGASRHSVLVT